MCLLRNHFIKKQGIGSIIQVAQVGKGLLLVGMMLMLQFSTMGQNAYLNQIRPIAHHFSSIYGIPAPIIMAVAIIESGGGNSRHLKLLNNHFGIKGPNQLWSSHGIRSAYKQYESLSASFLDFCKLLTRKSFYSGLKGNANSRVWADAISQAGYSTAPIQWRQKVLSAIEKYHLF